RKQRARSEPSQAVVVADEQRHGRSRAGRTIGHRSILRIEHVNVPMAVGGYRRLPLVAGAITQACLRSEARNRQRRLRRRQGEHDQQRKALPSSWRGLEAAGGRDHRTCSWHKPVSDFTPIPRQRQLPKGNETNNLQSRHFCALSSSKQGRAYLELVSQIVLRAASAKPSVAK